MLVDVCCSLAEILPSYPTSLLQAPREPGHAYRESYSEDKDLASVHH